jgi:hypothetical protein
MPALRPRNEALRDYFVSSPENQGRPLLGESGTKRAGRRTTWTEASCSPLTSGLYPPSQSLRADIPQESWEGQPPRQSAQPEAG